MNFRTDNDLVIPAVTAQQMREVDRIAVEEFHLDILQMMENAGRSLAHHVRDMLGTTHGSVTILAGAGGNSGGGLCCARHLHNRHFHVHVVLDRSAENLSGPARNQLDTLRAIGIHPSRLSCSTPIKREPDFFNANFSATTSSMGLRERRYFRSNVISKTSG